MWWMLVLSLPSRRATARMRAWRALKSIGAAVLRDGVYLLPDRDPLHGALRAIAADVRASGGQARVMRVEPCDDDDFASLFDRAADYAPLLADIATWRSDEAALDADTASARAGALQRRMDALRAVDHLPGEATRQAEAAMAELHARLSRRLQPGEPQSAPGDIARRSIAEHRGRVWATRRRPWVDRLACAWLIRRFIDPDATLLWLSDVRDCPADALGFDFDGATFSHVDARVTFETLLAAFDLETPSLRRIGALVHRLDVGGAPVPEAEGIERVLAGMRAALSDDDRLFLAAAGVFEGLWTAYERNPPT